MKTIAIKLPDDLLVRIRDAAMKRGETMSAVMREALQKYFSGERNQNDLSCLDLARDIAGSFDGPPDLSTNPRYMSHYGR